MSCQWWKIQTPISLSSVWAYKSGPGVLNIRFALYLKANKVVNRQTCLSCSSPLFTFFSASFMETFSAYFVNLGQVLIFERGDLFSTEKRTGQQTDEWFSLFGTEIMGGLHSSTFVWVHIEQKLQIKKTLESSAKMISTEDRISSRLHCNQAFYFHFCD